MSVASYLIDRVNNEIPTSDDKLVSIAGLTAFADNITNVTQPAKATEYYLEDGSNASDHIIQNPLEIEIDGYVANVLRYRKNPTVLSRATGDSLAIIGKYTNNQTQAQINKAISYGQSLSDLYSKYDQIVRDGLSIYELFGDKDNQSDFTTIFYQQMTKFKNSGQLIKVKTKIATYENLVIENFIFTQDFNNKDSASFKLNLKQIRFVSNRQETVSPLIGRSSGNMQNQVSSKASKGLQNGQETSVNLVSNNAIFNSSLRGLL